MRNGELSMTRILPAATAVVALLACGLVHGLWTDRWGPPGDATAVAARFDSLPLTVGDWQGEGVPASARETQGLSGYLARRYANRQTGDVVTLALMCGRPRVVSIHTPDVCYAASGYEVSTPGKVTPASPGPPVEFWTTEMVRTRAAEQTRLRIFYAWNATGDWVAPDNPRVAFAGTPVLCKLYLLRELPSAKAALADDPCLDLFERLQPELQQCLFPDPSPLAGLAAGRSER
jgi:hypothetical protein